MIRANDIKLRLKAEEFSHFLRDLHARLGSGVTFQDVVDHEVARVLEAAARRTGKADESKIRHKVAHRSRFKYNGKIFYTREPKSGGRAWHVPDEVWSYIQQRNEKSLARRLAAVGITKKSWVDIADKMGVEVQVPAFIRAARVTQDTSGNTTATASESSHGFMRRIENRAPILFVKGTEAYQAFFSAVHGRIAFFNRNLARGAFDTIESVAKKYRGIAAKLR